MHRCEGGPVPGAHEALLDARHDFEVRAHRSLVLASEAADSDLAERWLDEEPGPESALLWARVAMLRALRMADAHDRRAGTLVGIAQAASERAAQMLPRTPLRGLLNWPCPASAAPGSRPQGLLTAPPGPW